MVSRSLGRYHKSAAQCHFRLIHQPRVDDKHQLLGESHQHQQFCEFRSRCGDR